VSPAITAVEALDIRFPTSRALDGSDAMNPDPDYSAAYAIVRTDTEEWEVVLEDFIGHDADECEVVGDGCEHLRLSGVLHEVTARAGSTLSLEADEPRVEQRPQPPWKLVCVD
jgi:L-fuconate dehydratase